MEMTMNAIKNPPMTRLSAIRTTTWGLTLGLLLLGGWLLFQPLSQAADVVVYKSPTCGCCIAWIRHLEANGFSVEAHDRVDMHPIKTELGVPTAYRSCHTAKVGGYVIEGHVPADLITRLLEQRPAVKGLAVPGMPMGSPGMDGPRKDAYQVLTFDDQGRSTVYANR
jgi:hypothetical protein